MTGVDMQNSKLKSFLSVAIASAVLGLSATPALAHHPVQAKFDKAAEMSITGVVTNVDWKNPHVHVFLNVKNGAVVANWQWNWKVRCC
jgi:hypothetical protein